jgi:hypothetical protein
MSLVETVIATGAVMFMFAFLAYLTYFTGRNFATLHQQLESQTSAAAAQERLVKLARNAAYYEAYDGDDLTSLTRIKVAMPNSSGGVTKWVVAFDRPTAGGTGSIKIFSSEGAVTFSPTGSVEGTPAFEFPHIENLSIVFESSFRLTIETGYRYRATAYLSPNPPQYGRFVTDVIAKNHFLDQGAGGNYALDLTTSGPATL